MNCLKQDLTKRLENASRVNDFRGRYLLRILEKMTLFSEQDHIGRVENALEWRPKDREFESFSSLYFFSEGGVSVSIHHVCV